MNENGNARAVWFPATFQASSLVHYPGTESPRSGFITNWNDTAAQAAQPLVEVTTEVPISTFHILGSNRP